MTEINGIHVACADLAPRRSLTKQQLHSLNKDAGAVSVFSNPVMHFPRTSSAPKPRILAVHFSCLFLRVLHLTGGDLHRNQACDQDGWEELTDETLDISQRARHEAGGRNVTVADGRQCDKTVIDPMRQ